MKAIRCKICSHDVETVFYRQFRINYYYCTNCESLFMDESEILPFEKEKTGNLTHNNTLENKGYVNMYREFIKKTITPYLDKKIRKKHWILAVGRGPIVCRLIY